jgi:hypothetical protein
MAGKYRTTLRSLPQSPPQGQLLRIRLRQLGLPAHELTRGELATPVTSDRAPSSESRRHHFECPLDCNCCIHVQSPALAAGAQDLHSSLVSRRWMPSS